MNKEFTPYKSNNMITTKDKWADLLWSCSCGGSNRPFSKMAVTEGGLETGGIVCLHHDSQRSISAIFVNIEMLHNCCVLICNATSKKNKNLRFHRFPKKRELKD